MKSTGDKPLHIAVGNLNIDIAFYLPRLPGPDEAYVVDDARISSGGAASNYAAAVRVYGHRAALVASTSTMGIADHLLEELRELGIIVEYVKRVPGLPGIVVIAVDRRGERIMMKYRGVNSLLSPNDVPRSLISEASILHIASVEPSVAYEIARRAGRLGIMISYDPGSAVYEDKEQVLGALRYATIVFLNRREAKTLVGSSLEKLLRLGPRVVVIKKGAAGAYAIEPGGVVVHGITKPIRPPVDSTGAGDAFAAFFNAAYIDTGSTVVALQHGVAAGALKTSCRGSRVCFDRKLFAKQLAETMVEKLRGPEDWVLED